MELNFNSVETISVLNASAAFKTDSGKVFKEDVDIVPRSSTNRCPTSHGEAITTCRTTSSTSSRVTKPSPPARCSTPRCATAAGCSTTPSRLPHRRYRRLQARPQAQREITTFINVFLRKEKIFLKKSGDFSWW